jgi:hypothetical protein
MIAGLALAGCHDNPVSQVDCGDMGLIVLQPSNRILNIGDTVTFRAIVPPPAECTPIGAYFYTEVPSVIAVDGVTGHATALWPGWADVILAPHHEEYALEEAWVNVREPPSADSLISRISNASADSALVTIEDATGTTQKTQVLAGGGSTCWITPLSDSVRYKVTAYERGASPRAEKWINYYLQYTHTWIVTVGDTTSPPTASLYIIGVEPPNPETCPTYPQVNDAPDTFQFQLNTGTNTVSTTENWFTYNWHNSGTVATVTQTAAVTSGTGYVTILDASWKQVYTQDLTVGGTFTTSAGVSSTSGAPWIIQVWLTNYRGTVNLSVQKN